MRSSWADDVAQTIEDILIAVSNGGLDRELELLALYALVFVNALFDRVMEPRSRT